MSSRIETRKAKRQMSALIVSRELLLCEHKN